MTQHALITGLTGQDGSYLAELLLAKGYRVFGLVRRNSTSGFSRLSHILHRLELLPGDVTDSASLQAAFTTAQPQEVYHLAAQSFVGASFMLPLASVDVTGVGTLRMLEALRQTGRKDIRFYQASSSEQFGNQWCPEGGFTEATAFAPVSPYGCAKTLAHHLCQVYRQSYGLFICCGIAFNHESERRGEEFVTRKITQGIAKIQRGESSLLRLGNLTARRDWSYAPDVMEAAWRILQRPCPEDYIVASGETHSVQDFVDLAFQAVGLHASDYVLDDAKLHRPIDIGYLCGNATKARERLSWRPTLSFAQLVQRMVTHDCTAALPDHPLPTP